MVTSDVSLKRSIAVLTIAWQRDPQGLRPDDEKTRLPGRERERQSRLVLAARNRLQAASDRLRHVSGGEQGQRRRDAGELVELDTARQKQRQDDDAEEQDRDDRRRAPEFDEGDARGCDLRMSGSATFGQKKSKRYEDGDGHEGQHEVEKRGRPRAGSRRGSARQNPAAQQKKGERREGEEKRYHVRRGERIALPHRKPARDGEDRRARNRRSRSALQGSRRRAVREPGADEIHTPRRRCTPSIRRRPGRVCDRPAQSFGTRKPTRRRSSAIVTIAFPGVPTSPVSLAAEPSAGECGAGCLCDGEKGRGVHWLTPTHEATIIEID